MPTDPTEQRLPLQTALVLVPGAALAAWYLLEAYRAAGTFGFPLDDSWIHAQFARNLATGRGFTYTGGEWVSGSTAPAWTLLLAASYFVVRSIGPAAFILGLLCQAAASYYALRLVELCGAPRLVAALAGVLVGVTPVMVWGAVSGMEVPLAAALVLAGLFHHFRSREDSGQRGYLGPALLGVSALARPENLALAAVVAVAELSGRGAAHTRVARFARIVIVAMLAFVPLVLFSYATIRRPLPTTFYAKSGPGLVRALETRDTAMATRAVRTFGPRAVHNFWLTLVDQWSWAAWLLIAAIAGTAANRGTRRLALTLLAGLVLVPYAMGVTTPQRLKPENVRYTAQLVAMAAPLLALGVAVLLRRTAATIPILALAIGLCGWRAAQQAPAYATAVKNIEELHVTAGRWMAEHLPPHSRVATNDVGAIGYFARRPILDLEGLVSPEVLPYRRFVDRGIRVVRDMRPDYVAIFPEWYPEIPASGEFREIHRVRITDNLVSAGDTLVIYALPWSPRR